MGGEEIADCGIEKIPGETGFIRLKALEALKICAALFLIVDSPFD